MKHTFTRVTLGAVIALTAIAAPIALATPAQAATTHTTAAVANKNLRNYTFMRDIYKTLDIVTSYTTHSAAGIGSTVSVNKVKPVQSKNIYKGFIKVTGTAAVFTITATNTTDHITKRLRSDHGHVTYLTA